LTATVTVKVLPPANPVAQNDNATTAFATAVVVNVLANDSDPNHFALTVSSITAAPTHGTAHVNPDNTITYTPAPTYSGSDLFSYAIANGHGGTASAQVTVAIQAALPPVARADSATTAFNTPVTIAVLGNDSDPNSLHLSIKTTTTPAHGLAQINTDNTITYTPATNYSGGDSFTYTIENSQGLTASANVAITVQDSLPPVATNDNATIPFTLVPAATAVAVLDNDNDPNAGLTLHISQYSQPTHGSVTQAGNTLIYTPKLESYGTLQLPYVGKDSFTYTISDNFKTATATVNVTLQLPPPPIAKDDAADCFKDASNISVEVLSNDTAQPGLPATVVSVTPPTNPAGQLAYPGASAMTELLADQQVLYTSADPSNQATYTSDTFQYTIRDPYGQTATAKVAITIIYP
jgi:hypothetical protein